MVKVRKKKVEQLTGVQTPRINLFTPGDTYKAELLFELLDEYGIRLLEWQKNVLRVWLAEDEDGNFVNLECGLSVPRQNGKTEIFAARVIYGIIFRKATGLLTTQLQDTADAVKKRVQDFFYENEHEEIFNLLTPRFRKKPKNYDFMEFTNGASYKFKTRMRLSGLGNTNDEVLNDEAAEMLDAHQSTLMPTVSASKLKNPQFIYAGTPPMAETVGTVFARVRDKIMKGGDGAWTEWSVESFSDCDDPALWYQANPSLGIFLLPKVVDAESQSLTPDDFNRMRLGWWSGIEDKRAISQKEWDALLNKKPVFDDAYKPVYAVKFSQDRSYYTLAVAQPLVDGKVHVEVAMHVSMRDGYHKLSDWLIDMWREAAAIVIDGQTGAPILYEELIQADVKKSLIIQPTMKEVIAAHQFMKEAIGQEELSHFGQPLLNQTVRITKERSFNRAGGFGWASMTDHMTTVALDAATFALWAQKTHSKKRSTAGDRKMAKKRWNEVLGSL